MCRIANQHITRRPLLFDRPIISCRVYSDPNVRVSRRNISYPKCVPILFVQYCGLITYECHYELEVETTIRQPRAAVLPFMYDGWVYLFLC